MIIIRIKILDFLNWSQYIESYSMCDEYNRPMDMEIGPKIRNEMSYQMEER